MARKEPLTISLEPNVREIIEEEARREKRSLNNFISYLLETHPIMADKLHIEPCHSEGGH